jgi:hypothetical protein
MAKKTTMKRKMKKRGTRRCWGGGQESKTPKNSVTKSISSRTSGRKATKTPIGQEYNDSIAAQKTRSKIKAESKIVSNEVNNDLSELIGSLSISTGKSSPK